MEIKYGFVPNTQETTAWRLRRRYRLIKGGDPRITLVHYTRGPVIRESRLILFFYESCVSDTLLPKRPPYLPDWVSIRHNVGTIKILIFFSWLKHPLHLAQVHVRGRRHLRTMDYEHGDCITLFEPRSRGLLLFSTSDTDMLAETVPSLLNSPVRQYPLRQLTELPVYVMGDKAGQKVYPQSAGPPPPQGPMGMNPQAMGMNQPGMGMAPQGMPPQAMGMNPQGIGMSPQAMLAQQNSNMESLERRRERERVRERSGSIGAVR